MKINRNIRRLTIK